MREISQRRSSLRAVMLMLFVAGPMAIGGAPVGAALLSQKAPNFSYPDLHGREVVLAGYRGRVVLLNFWATWCGPCLLELPRFAEWQQQVGAQNLQIIGVSMDDTEQPVRLTYAKYRLNYPVFMGDEKLGEKYGGILGLPVSLLIDRQGIIRFDHRGDTDLDQLYREMQSLLQKR